MNFKIFKKYFTIALLFIATLATTTLAGADWMGIRTGDAWEDFSIGFWYSIPFLGILTIHEFGHYLTARWYKVKTTLPYYIPMYLPGVPMIGTMGAFIRIKSAMQSKKMVFDIGIAGPLAGFLAAMILLFYGFTHLPEKEYIYKVHKDYAAYGTHYEEHVYNYQYLRNEDSLAAVKMKTPFVPQENYMVISMGTNLMFKFFETFVVPDVSLIPNRYEMFHYPFLLAGFLALFFTALNLIPIGQLDGGHILYGLIGAKRQHQIAPVLFSIFTFMGTIDFLKETFGLYPMQSFEDMVSFLPLYLVALLMMFSKVFERFTSNLMLIVIIFAAQYFTLYFFPNFSGFSGWWVFIFIVGRFLGIYHPPSPDETPLDWKRKLLGWFSLAVFILCFSPEPFLIEYIGK